MGRVPLCFPMRHYIKAHFHQLNQCLNGKTVNEQSVTKTKYGRLEITWPAFDHDLIDALENTNFVNNVVRMERKIRGSLLTTGYTNT